MTTYSLFSVFGIEAEYMIVKKDNLKINPIFDQLLMEMEGDVEEGEVAVGEVCWSNELVRHVAEIKGNGPSPDLEEIEKSFHRSILTVNKTLQKKWDSILLPSAMHPTMRPEQEMVLWPYGNKIIYENYHRVFNCKGHGWSNLQSVHINLPFATEEEFGKLHAACRMVLPLIPLMAASSPFVEESLTSFQDNRLEFYRLNQQKIPLICGDVIPEAIWSFNDYQKLMERIFEQMAPHDPDNILRRPWLNSRGVIPKFDYGALEIRVMDIQECPKADFALISFIVALTKNLVEEKVISFDKQKKCSSEMLSKAFQKSLQYSKDELSEEFIEYANYFNLSKCKTREKLLLELFQKVKNDIPRRYHDYLLSNFKDGTLAAKIKERFQQGQKIEEIYRVLHDCLITNTPLTKCLGNNTQ
jgi:glutamate---cysteine ligase / carboxylate-amine ligase